MPAILANKDAIQEEVLTEISGNRRAKQRFGLALQLKYKIMKNYLVTATGTGSTVNMSSGGVAFTANEIFKIGAQLELAVSWPVLLNGDCPMKVLIEGRVVRSDDQLTVIRVSRHEFRTQKRSELQPERSLAMAV